ncbi:hypothetical protein GJAV_G00116560 [Gymnothorax javanicus]|nr:hypothetical protein GJAV_G00116560 [Gymnothorax javanicus]
MPDRIPAWSRLAASGWNEAALLTTFHQGLDPGLRLYLSAYDDTIGLERFIRLAIRVSHRLESCLQELSTGAQRSPKGELAMRLDMNTCGSEGKFISGALWHRLRLTTSSNPHSGIVKSITSNPQGSRNVKADLEDSQGETPAPLAVFQTRLTCGLLGNCPHAPHHIF